MAIIRGDSAKIFQKLFFQKIKSSPVLSNGYSMPRGSKLCFLVVQCPFREEHLVVYKVEVVPPSPPPEKVRFLLNIHPICKVEGGRPSPQDNGQGLGVRKRKNASEKMVSIFV